MRLDEARVSSAAGPATLEVSRLRVHFGGVVALDGVSLDVGAGEVVGIIGPNGAGKTTLFNAVCGFVRPDAGEIRYAGRPLRGVRPDQLTALGITRTLQGLGLWRGLTVLENVMAGARRTGAPSLLSAFLGLPGSDRHEARLAADARLQLRELGIEAHAGRHPDSLPYGVQKWVSLARALMARPSLLLLDEPASGLTDLEIKQLVDLLRRVRERTSIALVEHRLDLVMNVCDRVHVLDFGRLIASGTPDQVRADPAVSAAYLGEDVAAGEAPHA